MDDTQMHLASKGKNKGKFVECNAHERACPNGGPHLPESWLTGISLYTKQNFKKPIDVKDLDYATVSYIEDNVPQQLLASYQSIALTLSELADTGELENPTKIEVGAERVGLDNPSQVLKRYNQEALMYLDEHVASDAYSATPEGFNDLLEGWSGIIKNLEKTNPEELTWARNRFGESKEPIERTETNTHPIGSVLVSYYLLQDYVTSKKASEDYQRKGAWATDNIDYFWATVSPMKRDFRELIMDSTDILDRS